jgi:beta-lactam-binding protein with PASTA domain
VSLPPEVQVPRVVGLSVSDARRTLRSSGLRFTVVRKQSTKPKGTIIKRAIPPGTTVAVHRRVKVIVAKPVVQPVLHVPHCGVFGNPWCYDFSECALYTRSFRPFRFAVLP